MNIFNVLRDHYSQLDVRDNHENNQRNNGTSSNRTNYEQLFRPVPSLLYTHTRTMAPVTRKRRAKQEEDAASEAQSSPAAGSLKGKRDEGTDTQAGGKGNLTVFGDDDSAPILPKPASKPSEKRKMEQQPEEEDSDDDAAPEAVSTQKVASDLKKSAQEAQHAAQECV